MSTIHDLRNGLRQLGGNPGFAITAILTLALGIGAAASIAGVLRATFLRPFPYVHAGRLVMVWDQLTKLGLLRFATSQGLYADYRARNRVFDDIAAFTPAAFSLTGAAAAERLEGARVSANLLPILGAQAAAGRGLAPEENQPGRGDVAVIAHSLAERRFGGAPSAGAGLTLDGRLYRIIGVLPRGFEFPFAGPRTPEVWVPLAFEPDPRRSAGALRLLARLKSGVTLQQARTEMSALAASLGEEHRLYRGPRGEDAGYRIAVVPLHEELYGSLRGGLLVLAGAVALLLLTACANVANLLLARAASRQREIATRRALGAARSRLVRQLLAENLPLALLGGAAGWLLTFWSTALLPSFLPPVSPDLGVLGFALAVSLATTLLFGLVPAIEASQGDLSETLKEGARATAGRGGHRAARLLVITQVALSLMLLTATGLLLKSFDRLRGVNPGFTPAATLTAQVSLPASRDPDNRQVAAFFARVADSLRAAPGIVAAGVTSRLPLTGGRGGDPFSIEGRPYNPASRTPQVVQTQIVDPGYFGALQIPLITGRFLAAADREESTPVVVVNETLARGFFPGGAIGKRILLGAPRPGARWLEIAGVAGDVRNASLDATPLPQMYLPLAQSPARSMTLVIRGAAGSAGLPALARRAVSAADPELPIFNVRTLEEIRDSSLEQPRFRALLLALFAAAALLLAAAGIYGVISHLVSRRTREIGVRMALGAQPAQVARGIAGQGLTLALAGVALGLAGTLALSRILPAVLFEVEPADPTVYAAAALILTAVALAASWLPAGRAARVDPVRALRAE